MVEIADFLADGSPRTYRRVSAPLEAPLLRRVKRYRLAFVRELWDRAGRGRVWQVRPSSKDQDVGVDGSNPFGVESAEEDFQPGASGC